MVDVIDENAVNIYTDGSSYSGPRRGGMGILFVIADENGNEVVFEEQPLGYQNATNQQMELQACIQALTILGGRRSPINPADFQKVILKTDSMYVVENIGKARFEWPKTKWHTRDGTPVANTSQWKDLVKAANALPRRVDFRWIKGHKSSAFNKRADKLAKGSAKGVLQKPLTVTTVRRKKSSKKIELGSVKMTEQMVRIRIVTDEYMKQQHCYKYKYEVMSKSNPFFGNVDLAYSEILLRAGHTYSVRFNDDTKNPRIMKMFREIA